MFGKSSFVARLSLGFGLAIALVAAFLLGARSQQGSPAAPPSQSRSSGLSGGGGDSAIAGGLLRLDGPVIFSVAGAANLSSLPLREGIQYGAFRSSDTDPANEQFIKYWLKSVQVPAGGQRQCLALYYNVSKDESFAGFYLKTGGADWTAYREGDLVLRLRQFEPLNETSVFDDHRNRLLDTPCTDRLKIELEALGSDGRDRKFALLQDVLENHRQQQREQGFFELRLPLCDFGPADHLRETVGIALVLENHSIDAAQRRGNLGLESIVLTQKRGASLQDVDLGHVPAGPVLSQAAVEIQVGAPSEPKVFESRDRSLVALHGPVVLQFRGDAATQQLTPETSGRQVVPKNQFGVFRNEQPRHVQFIEEQWRLVNLPNRAHPIGVLCLAYEVPREFNGWWCKLHGADWSKYSEGFLVLELFPGPVCTSVFKLELKTREGGPPFHVYVRLSAAERAQAAREGRVNVAVPLAEFGITDLSRLAELVICFESGQVTATKGELGIGSIRLFRDQEEIGQLEKLTLLDDLAYLGFCWFQDHRHAATGQVLDRAPNWPRRGKPSRISSIASTAYLLSLLPEWVRRGWLTHEEAQRQARQAIDFALNKVGGHRGLFWHFIHQETGERWDKCEVSSLDSGILISSCMASGEFFQGEVKQLADKLVDRAEWDAFLVKGASGEQLLSLGWSPEKGLLSPIDVRSSEMAMPLFLAVGSRRHSIDPECWYNTAVNYGEVAGTRLLNKDHALFTSFYGLGWHDLEGRLDRDGVDLFGNARAAALANRAFCARLPQQTFQAQSGRFWGLSAGDSVRGYVAVGPVFGASDGTVFPLAALATLPSIPTEVQHDLAQWRKSDVWPQVCGRYGLSPFNLEEPGRRGAQFWVGDDLIGIDIGSFCVSVANYQAKTVWTLWSKHEVARSSLSRLRVAIAPANRE